MWLGDAFPAILLPRLDGLDAALAKLQGKQATVVILWGRDYWMTRAALSDLAKDVPRLFENKPVALVGVAVGHTPATANPVLAATGAKFPQLLDAEGQAVAKVTAAVLPQIYVLDGTGKVAWFDIEYSESTRRELQQTLEALLK